MPARIAIATALALAALAATAAPSFAIGQPVNRAAPELTLNGGTLTTTDGRWVGVTRPFAYAWFRCLDTDIGSCVQVPGRTTRTYALGPADGGKRIRSNVTGSNAAGSQDVFSDPTGVVARTPTGSPGTAPLLRIKPFPVVVITGRQGGGRTRITGLVVRGPKGVKVAVRCRGRRCPFSRTSTTIGAKKRVRIRRAQRLFRAGQAIEIRMTQKGRIGKFTKVRFRRGRTPARSDKCLLPGAKKPSTCLTS
jgi:hypothetical protein